MANPARKPAIFITCMPAALLASRANYQSTATFADICLRQYAVMLLRSASKHAMDPKCTKRTVTCKRPKVATDLVPNGCKDVSAILHVPNMLLARRLGPSIRPSTTRPALHSLILPGPIHQLARTPIPFLSIGNHVPTPTNPISTNQYRQSCKVVA